MLIGRHLSGGSELLAIDGELANEEFDETIDDTDDVDDDAVADDEEDRQVFGFVVVFVILSTSKFITRFAFLFSTGLARFS